MNRNIIFLFFVLFYASHPTYAKHYELSPGTLETQLPVVLATLEDGDSIDLPAGTFHFSRTLNVVAKNIFIRGAGKEKTKLIFSQQKVGAQAILVRGWDIHLKGFSLFSPAGDGLVVRNSARVSLEHIHVDMNRADSSTSGAYGFYPVRSQHITMQNLSSTGASDAGIYLGQSKFAVIRDCEAYSNVTGINIENSIQVSVENNHVHNNAIGIFMTSLPDMIYPSSKDVYFIDNIIKDNNDRNFSTKGTLIHEIKPGIGLLLIATQNAYLAKNTIQEHKRKDALITDYQYLNRPPHPGTFQSAPGITMLAENELGSDLATNEAYENKLCKTVNSNIQFTTLENSKKRINLDTKCSIDSPTLLPVQVPITNENFDS